ncbi:hypothetical protein [Fibrivirga algicola]|uniref:Copper resistance protein NlpE n=1 Tax=Fibrivirga algicola TaxID=2950420 RepID=A0ABX0QBA5_9BACT|nr:hypothetical protein [Fibrivirga algicola]ARK11120.1 hypothetical protein A6C57_12740 [Fibrella sp. ES10-3-2-2]NID09610.1 hypothetical protein [Fibrivirga algicola]
MNTTCTTRAIRVSLLMLTCLLASSWGLRAQPPRSQNVPLKATGRLLVPTGPSVLGTFDGRFPCADIARDWKLTVSPECWKVKWRITLFQDPVTHAPTTYKLRGVLGTAREREGKWTRVQGSQTDPNAEVYQLDSETPGIYVYLLKGDDNVLFILDQAKGFRVGTADLSYTLNRVDSQAAGN